MQFPIAIHREDGSVYGVTVPDIPGCHSYGDTIDEAIKNAKEAAVGHLETLLEIGDKIDLRSSSIEDLQKLEEFKDAIWGVIELDLSELDSKPERVNISLPSFVLRRIDHYVSAKHETRSGFIARAALSALAHDNQ